MEKTILVQKNTNGRLKFIALVLDGDTITRIWGLLDGKSQTTANTYGFINKGKANQLDPVQAAKEDFDRIISTKIKEGYIVVDDINNPVEFNNDKMNFDDLPVQFCCSKPNTKVSEKQADQFLKYGKGRYYIKENGLCHYILITSTGEIKIYSRRIDDHTRKYGTVVDAVRKLNLPANTLLVAEFVIDPALNIPHMDGFKLISSISRSDTLKGKVKESVEQTLYLQMLHPVKAVVFNVLYYDNEDLTQKPYSNIIDNYFTKFFPLDTTQDVLILPRKMAFYKHNKAIAWTEVNSRVYEGLVLWDIDANAEITYNGKPMRRGCYKVKAQMDDDVIAYGWNEGTGDHQGQIGSLKIGKYNQEGEIVDLGKCGSGISDELCDPGLWTFPCVIEISYSQRFPTGSYQFPVFVKVHEDKLPEDIILDEDGN